VNILTRKPWSPYIAGVCVGILLCLSVVLTGKFLGASTTFVRAAGMIESIFDAEHVRHNLYFMNTKVQIDWQWMLVVGIFFGSLIASRISGDYKLTAVPPMWQGRFGKSVIKRWGAAFIGGAILIFGARMAGG
jgi:hypothetical protein